MKVTRKNDDRKKADEIKCGECFLYDDNLYIATDECGQFGGRRCVQLRDGRIIYFEENLVTPVDAEVVIND